MKQFDEVRTLLDNAVALYIHVDFIENDPIQIPHRFTRKEDIEIAGFLAATLAWGQRKTIVKNGDFLMDLMENSPFDFVKEGKDFNRFSRFVHRTFNGADCVFFLNSLKK